MSRTSFYGQVLAQTGRRSAFPTYVGKQRYVFGNGLVVQRQQKGGGQFPIYVGKRYKGFGFWSDIGGKVKDFFRPLMNKETLKYLGKKGLKAALGIAKDTLVKDDTFLDSLKKRAGKIGKEVVHDIKEKVSSGT